jgi:O-antigen/teichoic acid export membrane protein
MRILAVLCQNPFAHADGGTYAVRASLRRLAEKGDLFITGFGIDFAQPCLGGYRSAGTLGPAYNSRLEFLKALARGRSYSMQKYSSPQAQRKLLNILLADRYSLVWFEMLHATAAAGRAGILGFSEEGRLHILRAHNVEHRVFEGRFHSRNPLIRLLLHIEQSRLKREELSTVAAMDYTYTISREDRDRLIAELPEFRQRIAFLPLSAEETVVDAFSRSDSRKTVLFVGDCRWRPNRLAVEWISNVLAPELERQCPDLVLRLVGRDTEKVCVPTANGEAAGFVGDIAREYERALCTIAPVWDGGGVNVKVIESLGHGVPVVGSSFARRGVDSEAFLEAEHVAEFVARIREIRERPRRRDELAIVARQSMAKQRKGFDELWSQLARGNKDLRILEEAKSRPAEMRIRALAVVATGVFIRSLAAFLFAKLTAALLGPVQYAKYGHFYLVASYLTTASTLGLANAFTIHTARNAEGKGSVDDTAHAVAALGTLAGVLVGGLLTLLFFCDRTSLLLPRVRGWDLAWWFGFCIICAAAFSIQSVLLGREKHGEYQLVTALNPVVSCISLVAAAGLTRISPVIAIITYMLGFAVPIIGYPSMVTGIRSIKWSACLSLLRFSSPYLLPGLLTPTLSTISILSVRHVIAANVSTYDLGLWQALWRLQEGYMGALIAVGTALFLPHFSKVTTRGDALKSITKAALILISMYLPLAICFLVFPRTMLRVLLSGQFTAISSLLPTEIVGDVLKIICFLLEIFFVSMVWPRLALFIEVLFSSLFLGLSWLLVGRLHSSLGAVIGYSISYALVLLILVPLALHRIRSLPARTGGE